MISVWFVRTICTQYPASWFVEQIYSAVSGHCDSDKRSQWIVDQVLALYDIDPSAADVKYKFIIWGAI